MLVVKFLLNMNFVLGLEEVNLIKTNWNINKAEVSLGLGVSIKSRFWVNINWESLLLHFEEVDLVKSDWISTKPKLV